VILNFLKPETIKKFELNEKDLNRRSKNIKRVNRLSLIRLKTILNIRSN